MTKMLVIKPLLPPLKMIWVCPHSGEKVQKKVGYFDGRKSDYSIEKVNFSENTFFLSQSIMSDSKKKNNKKLYFIAGQIFKSLNPPQDVSSYTLKENEF